MAFAHASKCTAKTKATGQRCKNPAVSGSTKCRMHGGATPRGLDSPHTRTGLYSKYLPSQIGDKVQTFLESDPLELLSELALLRALLAEYLSRFDGINPSARDIELLADLAERVGKFSERINKMRNDTALTGAEMAFLAARVADIVVKYIDDPDTQRAFVADFVGALRANDPGSSRIIEHGAN